METKYGEGTLKSLNSDEYCYIKNERFPYEAESYYRIWENESISITFAIKSNRDRDTCNKNIKTFIIADDNEKIKKIDLKNETLSNSIKEKLKNEEKSKLQNL